MTQPPTRESQTPSGETTPAPGSAAPSAPSIEKARKALSAYVFSHLPKPDPIDEGSANLGADWVGAYSVMGMADAYAQAVLEEAWAAFWAATDEQAELDAIRDRIEALGRS